MTPDDVGKQLHDRATRGQPLSAEEQKLLSEWYARLDEEATSQPDPNREARQAEVRKVLAELVGSAQHIQALEAENERLRREVAALQQQLAALGEAQGADDIRGAYPLMDAVARREGWDDPEMDSYDVFARRERP